MPTTALDLPSAARLFLARSDETRLGILAMLGEGERCVCDLQADLDAAQSRLSVHLKVRKGAGLVTDQKEGRWSYYADPEDTTRAEREAAGETAPRPAPSASDGGLRDEPRQVGRRG